MIRVFIGALFVCWLLCGCGVLRSTPKYAFSNGYYKASLFSPQTTKVFVNNEENFVLIYPVSRAEGVRTVDTSHFAPLALPQQYTDTVRKSYAFHKKSFDIDFLTIPFKYRPRVNEFPRQFTSNLNGGVYLGFRNDSYVVRYKKDALGKHHRHTSHFGFSVGGFSGIGGTAMNPWVTNNQIGIEYDGVVWTKGVTSIIGLDQFTLGLAVGWDHLQDSNKRFWIYQGKLWVGLVFGLNLN